MEIGSGIRVGILCEYVQKSVTKWCSNLSEYSSLWVERCQHKEAFHLMEKIRRLHLPKIKTVQKKKMSLS
jgi:hypothetical protein